MPLPDVIHRIELPIDDRPHGIDLKGDLFHAAVRRPGSVDVWYVARRDDSEPMRRSFQVVATGQPIPAWLSRHHATAITPDGQLVWHVLENHCPHPNIIEMPPDTPVTMSGVCAACGVSVVADRAGRWAPV